MQRVWKFYPKTDTWVDFKGCEWKVSLVEREYCTHCYVGSVATQSSRKVRLERHIGCISGIFKFVLWRIWFFVPSMSGTGILGLYPVQWDETTDHVLDVMAIQTASNYSLSISVCFLLFVLFSCLFFLFQ